MDLIFNTLSKKNAKKVSRILETKVKNKDVRFAFSLWQADTEMARDVQDFLNLPKDDLQKLVKRAQYVRVSSEERLFNSVLSYEELKENATLIGRAIFKRNDLNSEMLKEAIGIYKLTLDGLGIDYESDPNGICGKVNPTYPEHQCVYPAGHARLFVDEEVGYWDHSDNVSYWGIF